MGHLQTVFGCLGQFAGCVYFIVSQKCTIRERLDLWHSGFWIVNSLGSKWQLRSTTRETKTVFTFEVVEVEFNDVKRSVAVIRKEKRLPWSSWAVTLWYKLLRNVSEILPTVHRAESWCSSWVKKPLTQLSDHNKVATNWWIPLDF